MKIKESTKNSLLMLSLAAAFLFVSYLESAPL